MKSNELRFQQSIPVDLNAAWDFFSSPLNLSRITPREMKFRVTSDYTSETKMYPGMIITYKVSPLWGINLNWMTEITHVKDREYFIDEQRSGPYALWHHQHHFKQIPGGIQMTDILNYAIPYCFIGRLADALFVGKKVKEIFAFREKAIESLFGHYNTPNQSDAG